MKKQREAEPMVKLTVRLSENLVERAKIRAIREKASLQDITAAALEAYLKTKLAPNGESR